MPQQVDFGPAEDITPIAASNLQVLLALGTLIGGVGSAAALIVSMNPRFARYRPFFGAFAVSGIVLGSVIGAINVLDGAPTPKLGLR